MGVLEQVNHRIKDEEPKNDCFQFILLFIDYNKEVYFCKKYLFVYKNGAEDNANLQKSELFMCVTSMDPFHFDSICFSTIIHTTV